MKKVRTPRVKRTARSITGTLVLAVASGFLYKAGETLFSRFVEPKLLLIPSRTTQD